MLLKKVSELCVGILPTIRKTANNCTEFSVGIIAELSLVILNLVFKREFKKSIFTVAELKTAELHLAKINEIGEFNEIHVRIAKTKRQIWKLLGMFRT